MLSKNAIRLPNGDCVLPFYSLVKLAPIDWAIHAAREMKLPYKVLLGVVLSALILGIVAFLGGYQHHTYTRYVPSSEESGFSESDFRLQIYPEFTSGGSLGLETHIPLLFYGQRERNSGPHVFLRLTSHPERIGYGGKRSVTLNSVTVKNEDGSSFPLTVASAAKIFGLEDTQGGSRREDLGPVDGNHLTIAAEGSVITDAGETRRFTFQQSWSFSHSTREGLGISFAE